MPISRNEFESGELDLTVHIMLILELDPESAWSAAELQEDIEGKLGSDFEQQVVLYALAALQTAGKIEHEEIWGVDYYCVTRVMDF